MKTFVAITKEYTVTLTAPKQTQDQNYILFREIVRSLNTIKHRATLEVKHK